MNSNRIRHLDGIWMIIDRNTECNGSDCPALAGIDHEAYSRLQTSLLDTAEGSTRTFCSSCLFRLHRFFIIACFIMPHYFSLSLFSLVFTNHLKNLMASEHIVQRQKVLVHLVLSSFKPVLLIDYVSLCCCQLLPVCCPVTSCLLDQPNMLQIAQIACLRLFMQDQLT